jgi:hypothetical protein
MGIESALREPIERVPQEYLASKYAAADFVDPLVIKSHPLGDILAPGPDLAGLDHLPECRMCLGSTSHGP